MQHRADLFEQASIEAEGSMEHRRRIKRLRHLAAGADRGGYSNDTGPLLPYTFEELKALAKAGKRRHVGDYLVGCRADARQCLLAQGRAVEEIAERVHELVSRGEGYRVDVSGIVPSRDWPEGPPASSLTAAIGGASWGSGATAQRQLSRRYRGDLGLPVVKPEKFNVEPNPEL
jgi:hypothetical protein